MQNNNNKNMEQSTKRAWKQHLYEILEYLQEKCISKKAMTLGAAVLMLVGLLGVRYRISGSLIPANSTVGGKALPIYCVQTEEPKIALTFDAAWGNEDTDTILDILKKHNLHVTFFMTGGWMEKYPEDVKKIYEAGHDVGNHSETHRNMSQFSVKEQKEEIMIPHQRIKEQLGIDMNLFRMPYGDYNNEVVLTVRESGYEPIQWSVDSLDWKDYGADSIVNTVLNHESLTNGAIILCHNGAKYTKDALERLIVGLEEKGYEIVPVSKLIYKGSYHMDVSGRQIKD